MFEHSLAYIDPGSGSLIIQVIIATVLAVPYFLRTQISRAINIVRGRGKAGPEAPDESSPAESG